MSENCPRQVCERVRQLLSELLDDELRGVVLEEVRTHLRDCPDCVLEVDSVKKTIRLYRQCSCQDVPVDIRIRLQDVIRRAREQG
ncbi:MAG: zf-HC2 domain-containing protein [Gemmatimonadetes bacterium]|nr:zf-HC2 domain-containing protein [Gemmatimonadota bacterium]